MADLTIEAISNQEESRLRLNPQEILRDYRIAVESRFTSLVGRREVFSGRAKFGIFGDGKEIAQLAMARAFRQGDFRSGYYRDQTFMFAAGMMSIREFFAQLYAHADVTADPHSAGRQMNAHFATRLLNPDGSWRSQTDMKNSSADISPTGSQMPRVVGLAYASRLYRELEELHHLTQFSRHGNEVAFATIGNASCAEGMFWEAINAIGVLKAPAVVSIWDDGYGISVPNAHQITKEDLSALLSGFQRQPGSEDGFNLYTVRGWDYAALVQVYQEATDIARREHIPAIIHVIEMTQPQGHSTSGSHERYKSKERLAWEEAFDGIAKMREWLIETDLATPGELDELEQAARAKVERAKTEAWEAFVASHYEDGQTAVRLIEAVEANCACPDEVAQARQQLIAKRTPLRRDILSAAHDVLIATSHENSPARQQLAAWYTQFCQQGHQLYAAHLHSSSAESALNVPEVKPLYSPQSPQVSGFEVLNACFDAMLARDPRVVAFGEDVGKLGGVNQTFAGLQAKYGPLRVSDTGIREVTILGQAIGMAMRGLRPIAEIQYLDYLLYALQLISDDLATLRWRTAGGQKAPVIISTRGHRLEGIWHAGSPMAGIIHLVRGVHVLVPRNMTQAAGFYNTLLLGDEPGLVVEVLNGYRLKETLPDNIGEFTVPLGVPEVLRPGTDVTLVTYGACCQIALTAAEKLHQVGISVEVIDVQSLLPFDRHGRILQSLQKTSRILFLDEDVPGGTTAYMMQQVLEAQGGYWWLDSAPRTLAAKPHRPAYGSDGAYFSKPNVEEVFDAVYEMMHEANPAHYPLFYR